MKQFTDSLLLAAGCAFAIVSLAPASWSQFSQARVLPGDSTVGPAAGDQRNVAIARGNNQSLMVWEDTRHTLSGAVAYSSTGAFMLCAARLDANGALIDTTPIVIRQAPASPVKPKVAWNGAEYLITWAEYVPHAFEIDRGVFAARVDVAGNLLDDPPLLLEDQSYVEELDPVVASDGNGWAVVWGGIAGNLDAIKGCVISASGVPGPLKTLMTATIGFYYPRSFELAWSNGRYLFVSEHFPVGGGSNDCMAQLFDAALTKVGSEFSLGAGTGTGTNPSVAGDGTGFCAVWNNGSSIVATPVSAAGAVLVPGGASMSGTLYVTYQAPAVAWDGQSWSIAFASSTAGSSGMNVSLLSSSGVLAAGSPQLVAQGNWTMEHTACAATASGSQLIWSDARGGTSAFAVDRADLFSARVSQSGVASPAVDLSQSPPAQTEPDLAGDEIHGYLVAFLSLTQSTTTISAQRVNALGAAIDANPIQITAVPRGAHNPAVAWNGTSWLVVWDEPGTPTPTIRGSRVSAGGTLLDSTPIALMAGNGPDVAAIGDTFLVVGSHEPVNHFRYLYTRRVRGSDGALLDPTPVQRTGSYDTQATIASFRDRWIIAYAHTVTHDSPYATIRWFTVDLNGSASTPGIGGDGGFTNNEPVLAIGGAQALLAWTSGGDIRARRILQSGVKLDSDAGLAVSAASNLQFQPGLGWNGSNFIVSFTDYRAHANPLEIGLGDVYACHVSPGGVVLDPAGLALATSPNVTEGRSACAGGGGIGVASFVAMRSDSTYGTCRVVLEASRTPLATYCIAKTNSLGCVPAIGWSGTPQAGASSGFTINGANVRNNTIGLLLYGLDGPGALPFHGGTLCIRAPANRTPGRSAGGSPTGFDCSGVLSMDFNAFASGAGGGSPKPALSQPGTSVHVQWWGRDNGFAPPDNVALSDALSFSM